MPGVKIPIIGYDIYNPLNKSKLDLKYCNDSIVNFQIPVSLEQNNLFNMTQKVNIIQMNAFLLQQMMVLIFY